MISDLYARILGYFMIAVVVVSIIIAVSCANPNATATLTPDEWLGTKTSFGGKFPSTPTPECD